MKTLTTIIACLLLTSASIAQVVIPSINRNLLTHRSEYRLTAGFINFKDDTFTGGVSLSDHSGVVTPSITIQTQVTLNDWSYFQVATNVFMQRNSGNFLEISAGVGAVVKNIQLGIGYKNSEFDYSKKRNTQDNLVISLGYRIKWFD